MPKFELMRSFNFGFCLLFFISCYDKKDICFTNPKVSVGLEFVDKRGQKNVNPIKNPKDTLFMNFRGFPKQKEFVKGGNYRFVPLLSDKSAILQFHNKSETFKENLTVHYNTEMFFFSEPCGFVPTHIITKITHQKLDKNPLIKDIVLRQKKVIPNDSTSVHMVLYTDLPAIISSRSK